MIDISFTGANLNKRIEFVKLFAIQSGIEILKIEKSKYKHFIRFIFDINNEIVEFHMLLKNVVGAGFPNKPHIKRIQIPPLSIDGMASNKNRVYSCLVGNICLNGKVLLVFWNPFRFVGHKTNRSCYVMDQSIIDTVEEHNGLYRTVDSEKELILCNEERFMDLIKEYIKRNGIDDYIL